MDKWTRKLRIGSCSVTLLGTIPGFGPDAARVEAAFDQEQPEIVALGIPEEDVAALARLAADPEAAEGLPEPDPHDARLFELLAPYGECRIPSPDLDAAQRRSNDGAAWLAAIDMDDDAHSDLFTSHVGFRHVIASNRTRKKVLKMKFPEAKDPYALATAWDAALNRQRPLQAVEGAREVHMAKRIEALAADTTRLLVILHVARLEGVDEILARAAS